MPESKNQTAKPLVESFIGKIFPYVRLLELENAELKQTNTNLVDRIVAMTTGLSLDDRPLTAEQIVEAEKDSAAVKTRRNSVDVSRDLEKQSLEKMLEHALKDAQSKEVNSAGSPNGNGSTRPVSAA